MVWLVFPLVLQGVLILIDEFMFHRSRGLDTWEVWGHPLDTLSVGLVFAIAAFLEFTPETEKVFFFMAVFSSLFVTKDEFIHAKLCPPAEHWLHAVLFLLHPLSFLAAWALWKDGQWSGVLKIQFLIILSFMFYQLIYWGVRWNRQRKA